MLRRILVMWMAGVAVGASASVIDFDFSQDTIGQPPPKFRSAVTGPGEPAQWKVAEEQVPPLLPPLETNAPVNTAERAIIAVQSFNLDAGHCPILLYTNEIFDDFTLTTRFKIGGGIIEPSAGLVFRAQDESNYYVLRASTEGNLLWYRVVGGQSLEGPGFGIGVKTPVDKDVWHELRVECAGSQFRCYLDGRLTLPPAQPGAPTNGLAINDTTFARGYVGFWTKADTKCYFTDARVQYAPRIPYIQIIVNNVFKQHPKLLGLKVYAGKKEKPGLPVVIGDMDEHGVGVVGTKTEADVIARGSIYYLKAGGAVEVTMPLRDRNGEIAAAIKIKMKAFPGETQDNALARALLVKKDVEREMMTLEDING